MRFIFLVVTLLAVIFGYPAFGQHAALNAKIQTMLDSLRLAGNFPGITVAVVLGDQQALAFASGYSNTGVKTAMKTNDYLMQGSVGKTYVSAIAMQFVKSGQLALDTKVSFYLGYLPWFGRIPNADDITVRMLMQHTSGIMRYEFKDAFTKDLTANPDKVWTPAELISYVLDEEAPFKAGEGWDYSDTNYIVLGMILEKLSGKTYYQLLQERILKPFNLTETRPTDKRKLPGLVQGYAGAANSFGGENEVIGADGNFIINPQFEWTGGGIYSTTRDLAKWGSLLYTGKVVDAQLLAEMLKAVPAKPLGRDTDYGLGIIVHHSSSLGEFYGHSGFFPGYLAELYYFPKQKFTIALQTNTSDFKNLKIYDLKILTALAAVVAEGGGN